MWLSPHLCIEREIPVSLWYVPSDNFFKPTSPTGPCRAHTRVTDSEACYTGNINQHDETLVQNKDDNLRCFQLPAAKQSVVYRFQKSRASDPLWDWRANSQMDRRRKLDYWMIADPIPLLFESMTSTFVWVLWTRNTIRIPQTCCEDQHVFKRGLIEYSLFRASPQSAWQL